MPDKVTQSKEILTEIQNLFSDGDRGWNSEEDMIAEMAKFRRNRICC